MGELLFKHTITYKVFYRIVAHLADLLSGIGSAIIYCKDILYFIWKKELNWKEIIEQCSRFGISSLPITLSIVGMTSVIVSMQVAGEMVKQGAGNFVGMLVAMLIIREAGVIMSGFALISMIGSSMASEVATMRVTEQIDAIEVLKVNPIRYLFVPRVVAGTIMMPPVLVIASVVGIVAGGIAAYFVSELSFKAYFESVIRGIYLKDMNVALLKALVFGFTITLISCTCGYNAKGGAKGVGTATTKAVVYSFIAIVLWDLIFSIMFFF